MVFCTIFLLVNDRSVFRCVQRSIVDAGRLPTYLCQDVVYMSLKMNGYPRDDARGSIVPTERSNEENWDKRQSCQLERCQGQTLHHSHQTVDHHPQSLANCETARNPT